MSLRVRLILLWALSSLLVIFLLFITGFLIFRRFSPTDQEILIEVLFPFRFYLLLPLVFLVLALIWGAKWFLEKYWFPLERMLEELELVRTVNPSLRIQTQGSTQLKALAAKLNQMAANTELTQQEIKIGIVFNNPVLDTLLLSAVVHPTQELHSLDSIAERLELEIDGRHTALGDSVVTAQIFLALLTLLEERGIFTLNQALETSQKTHYARLRY